MNHIGSVLQLTASGPPFVSLMRSFMATSVPSFWKPHSATVLPVSMSSCMAKEGFDYCRFRMYYECGRPAVMGLGTCFGSMPGGNLVQAGALLWAEDVHLPLAAHQQQL